jgi:hypothetical protein
LLRLLTAGFGTELPIPNCPLFGRYWG